jgi:hypothetical protein
LGDPILVLVLALDGEDRGEVDRRGSFVAGYGKSVCHLTHCAFFFRVSGFTGSSLAIHPLAELLGLLVETPSLPLIASCKRREDSCGTRPSISDLRR